MDDTIYALDGLVKNAQLLRIGHLVKVVDLDKVELSGVLRPGLDHGIALGQRPRRTTHPDTSTEQLVDHMGTDEAGCTRDENVLAVFRSVSIKD